METTTKPKRPAALGFIFVTLLIDIIGFGVIIPVFPSLIQGLLHCDLSVAGRYGGYLMFAYASMQFFFSPLIGNLSDKYGRRPVLLTSLLGFGIDYLFLAFAPSIWWLFLGRIIAGITGASFTTATAYIADVSTDENRAQNFGIVGMAFGMGFIIGPFLGGILGDISLKLPFFVAAGLALLNALYGFFVLPESLSKENRREFDIKRANPFKTVSNLKRYPAVAGLIISLILIYLASHSVQSTWTYVTIEKFNWSKKMIGYSLVMIGALVGLVQGLLIRVTIPKLGKNKSVVLGLLLYSAGLLLYTFASQTWMMFAFSIPYCLGGIAGPALQGIITGEVPSNEQGELQGGLTSLISVTSIFGPLIMTNLFSYFSGKSAPIYFPGAPFLMGALLMLVSAIFAVKNFKKEKKQPAEA
ncbi:TCR/Tet family MFS transporter [Mucilaginibacter sp. HMF5004]|uniref:TCR/Tet family MFS transporter n=1 Tax=Mucilaginibacter rivuli TaxID=2857527 RepID=UPI001C5F91D5|nr:TCR/Tet family MFS transporter [Mucilaginibacter rivuli]MBW4889587.1 TCR/Tet family MFS transporter [Mucilaginibacter rivuli]